MPPRTVPRSTSCARRRRTLCWCCRSGRARPPGLDALDQAELDRSLRLKLALDTIRETRRIDAFAIRCWPETFIEYGGAVCGPVAMEGEARVPCACETDVWDALTQVALQHVADASVLLVDLVDVDPEDDSAIVWHCGQAPLSMAGGRDDPHQSADAAALRVRA